MPVEYFDIDEPITTPISGVQYMDADDVDWRQENAFLVFGSEFGKGIARGFLNVGSGIVGTAEWLIPGKQESLIEAQERIKLARERVPMTHQGAAAWGGRVLGEALPYMGSAMVAGYAGAGVAGAAGLGAKGILVGQGVGAASIGFSVEGQDAYDHAIATGATESEANTERLVVGTVNAALEAIQINRLLKFHKTGKHSLKAFIRSARNKAWKKMGGQAKAFGADILRLSIEEAAEEALQEGVSLTVPGLTRDQWLRKADGSVDVWSMAEQVGEAALGGAFAGAVLGGAGAMIGATPELARATEAEIQDTATKIRESGLNETEKKIMLRELEGMREVSGVELIKNIPLYHGSEFSGKELKPNISESGDALFLTSDPISAEGYGRYIHEGTVDIKNPLRYNAEGKEWFEVSQKNIIESAKKAGYDSVIFENIKDSKYGGLAADVYAIFSDKQFKSADIIDTQTDREWYLKESKVKGDYKSLVSTELTPVEQLRNKLDEKVEGLERLRPIEEEEISRERGKRFAEFREIVKDVKDPRARVKLAKAALKGQLKQEITPLEDYIEKEDIDLAYDTITTSTQLTDGQMISADEGLSKMFFDGMIPAKHELAALEKSGVLSKEATQNLLRNRTKWQKSIDVMKDIAFAPWSILTSYDLSFSRQGWMMAFSKPGLFLRTQGRAWRMLASEKYFKYIELRRKTHPLYQEALKRGVEETTLGTIGKKEEMFASGLVQKLPGIHPSARAFVGALNELRFGWYFQARESNEGLGMTSRQQKELGALANDLTGRGKLPKALKTLQNFGLIFFAPRLQAARIRTITDLATMKGPARKMLAGTLVKFLGITLTTLWLLDKDDDITVEWNPTSSDFLKVKRGNTRIDITGGYQQLLRYTAQAVYGKRKSTTTGRLYDVARKDVISRFIQSKLSPHAGLMLDLWRGETFMGDKLRMETGPIAKQFYERLTPLFFQDVIDAANYQGMGTATAIAPLAFHGVGVQTYPQTISQDNLLLKNRLSKEFFGMNWDDIGPQAQKELKEYQPQIELNETEATKEREDYDFIGKLIEEAQDVSRKIERGLPKPIRNELDDLVVDIGGLNRRIGSNWYLNDVRYKQYQKDVKLSLTKYLSLLLNNPQFKRLPPDIRRAMMQEVIQEVKVQVRKKIVTQANIKDLRTREQLRGRKI